MNIMEKLEQMSEAEISELLNTDFGAELEKQASQEVAQDALTDALYSYGAFMCASEYEACDETLSKEAVSYTHLTLPTIYSV